MPLENTTSPDPIDRTKEPMLGQVVSRRSVLKMAGLGVISAFLGSEGNTHGEQPGKSVDYTVTAHNKDKDSLIITDKNPITILESQFNYIPTDGSSVDFSLDQIPLSDESFPALVIVSNAHVDAVKPQNSLQTKLMKWLHDLPGFQDRVVMVLTKDSSLTPAIKTDESMTSLNRNFFSATESTKEELIADLNIFYPEFNFSDEVLQAIVNKEVFLYFHNFGSLLGHGEMAQFDLVKK